MKKIPSILAIGFTLCFVLALSAFGASAEAAGAVYDNAKLLSQGERERLAQKIQRLEQAYNIRVGIVTQPGLQGRPVGQVANALLDQGYRGAPNGGIVLLLAMQERDWYISTDNAMRARITDKEGMKYIESEMVPKLKEGRYGEAFEKYVDAVETMASHYAKEGKPFDPSSGFHPLAALAALAIGTLGGWTARSAMISSMSNVTPAARASEYLVGGSFSLTETSDRFLFMNVARVPKSKGHSGGHSAADSDHGGGGGKF